MPSLNLDLDYFDHIKARRLVGLLGRGSEVLPIRLWCFCGKHRAETGSLAGISAQEIESICAWWGKSGEMIKALVSVGFLDETPDGYQIHDWLKHAGHIVRFKRRAQENAAKRWNSANGTTAGNATSIALAEQSRAEQSKKTKTTTAGGDLPRPRELFPGSRTPRDMRAEIGFHVARVWDNYVQKFGKDPVRLTLTKERRNIGINRFQESLKKTGDYEAAEKLMIQAIDALAASPHHMGQNDRNTVYDSWEKNLFKDANQFETWLDKARNANVRRIGNSADKFAADLEVARRQSAKGAN